MATQTTYSENQAQAVAGAIASTEPSTLISRTVEDAAGIGFGKIVQQGAGDNGCTADLDTSDIDATSFLGITVRERSTNPATPDKFAQYESARIMRKGVAWVQASLQVAAGDPVYVVRATGALHNASDAARVLIPNARWETSTSGAGLAKIRLG